MNKILEALTEFIKLTEEYSEKTRTYNLAQMMGFLDRLLTHKNNSIKLIEEITKIKQRSK